MDKKAAATFLLCLMAVCIVSDVTADAVIPSKTESFQLMGTTGASNTNKRTLDGLRLAGGAQKGHADIEPESGEKPTNEEKAALWGRKLRATYGRKLRATYGRKLKAAWGRKLKAAWGR